MPKQSKAQHFRMLLPVIRELEEVYQQEGIVQILKERYNLKLTLTTYRNYLYRYNSKEDNENKVNSHLDKTVVNVSGNVQSSNKKTSDDKNNESSESIEPDNVKTSDDDEIDYDALLEHFKSKHQTKSLLDKED